QLQHLSGKRTLLVECRSRKLEQGREEHDHNLKISKGVTIKASRMREQGCLLQVVNQLLRYRAGVTAKSSRKSRGHQSQANRVVFSAEDSSRSQAHVTMMKTTDLWDRNNWASIEWLYFARFWAIFLQG